MVSKDKLESWRWRGNPNKCYVFWSLLFKANYKPEGFEKITVGRGQLVFSYDKLSAELGVPLQTLRTTLKDLIETGDIYIQPTRRWSLLTICEYDSWQNFGIKANTLNGTQTDTLDGTNIINKEEYIRENINPYNPLEGDGGSNVSREEFEELKKAFEALSDENKRLREEKEKSEKKKRSVFKPPTEEEVASYIREMGYHFDATSFVSFYQSKGWMVGKSKMKDWKAACKTWESHRNKDGRSEESPAYENSGLTRVERFTNWVDRFYPTIRDMEMPNEKQLNEMLRICNNEIEGYLDRLQDDYHTGSLYDLFIERFGNG